MIPQLPFNTHIILANGEWIDARWGNDLVYVPSSLDISPGTIIAKLGGGFREVIAVENRYFCRVLTTRARGGISIPCNDLAPFFQIYNEHGKIELRCTLEQGHRGVHNCPQGTWGGGPSREEILQAAVNEAMAVLDTSTFDLGFLDNMAGHNAANNSRVQRVRSILRKVLEDHE